MNQFYVVLFSQFSQSSQKFINSIQSADIGINFNLLNIDNPDARKKILTNKKLNIKNVPCLLVVYQENGSVEKYEGQDCFIWLNDILVKKQQQIIQQQQQQQLQQKQLLSISEDFNEQEDEPIKVNNKRKKTQNQQPVQQKKKKVSQQTFIDDINSEDEIELEDLEDLVNNDEDTTFDAPIFEAPTKKRQSDVKRDSLLSMASEMQKLREIDDKKLKNDTRPI